jgi:exopolysaccharide production protein ExoQ
LYAYGILGSVLFIGIYVSLFRSIQQFPDIKLRPLLKMFFFFVVIRGLAEAEPFDLLIPVWLLLLLGSFTPHTEDERNSVI